MDIINTLLEKRYEEGIQFLKKSQNFDDVINFRSKNDDTVCIIH